MSEKSSGFQVGEVYKGKVKEQIFGEGKEGIAQVSLMVNTLGRLTNARNPDSPLAACEATEVEVRLAFDPSRDEGLRIALDQLERLGFSDLDNLDQLHPEHPQHHSFVGQEVHISPKEYKDSLVWNLRFPRRVSTTAVDKAKAAALSRQVGPQLKAAIEAQQRKKEEELAASTSVPF